MRIACGLLAVALGCAGPFDEPAAPVALSASELGVHAPLWRSIRIDLTAGGRLRIGDEPHTLAEAAHAARGGPVLVRADGAASLLHLQMLLGELRRARAGPVHLAVCGRDGNAVIRVPEDAFPMETWAQDADPAHASLVVLAVTPAPGSGLPAAVTVTVCERMDRDAWPLPRTEEAVPWDATFAARAGDAVRHVRHDLHLDPVGVVQTDSRLTIQGWVDLLAGLSAAGLERVLWPAWPTHRWTCSQDPLPLPPAPYGVGSHSELLEDLTGKPLAPVLLPLAPDSEMDGDDDPDDRVIVSVDEEGRWFGGYEEVGLEGVRHLLRTEHAENAARRRAEGREPTELTLAGVPMSRLYVLLRADRRARWREVERFLALLRTERFYKLQIATAKSADLRYDARDAALHGVPWRPALPIPESLEAKSQVFLRAGDPAPRPGETLRYFSIECGADDRCRFLAREWDAEDAAELRAHMDGTARFDRAVVRVAPEADMQAVVTLVDAVHTHGCQIIDFECAR